MLFGTRFIFSSRTKIRMSKSEAAYTTLVHSISKDQIKQLHLTAALPDRCANNSFTCSRQQIQRMPRSNSVPNRFKFEAILSANASAYSIRSLSSRTPALSLAQRRHAVAGHECTVVPRAAAYRCRRWSIACASVGANRFTSMRTSCLPR
jgi:hypothetical protein